MLRPQRAQVITEGRNTIVDCTLEIQHSRDNAQGWRRRLVGADQAGEAGRGVARELCNPPRCGADLRSVNQARSVEPVIAHLPQYWEREFHNAIPNRVCRPKNAATRFGFSGRTQSGHQGLQELCRILSTSLSIMTPASGASCTKLPSLI